MTKKTSSGRPLFVRLKTSRGRTTSSQKWLLRQLNDPYIQKAKVAGYRSRAAYKLIEINDKFKILKPGSRVVDLGAAPGGWTQVTLEHIGAKGQVVGVDLTPIEPLMGAHLICGDFCDPQVVEQLKTTLMGSAHVVLSDMAASSTGHTQTDHIRIMALAEEAFAFAQEVLEKGGSFVVKVLRGGTEKELLGLLKKHFEKVSHYKPPASRSDSAEMYVVAIGFRP
ncbi:MAG: rRNA methyltransferase [Alphaproteobacteria bacterium 41-28]|nr:MAG: rRNA methyltransferase [Alphaproteobacteria bacterium 41-28]